MCSSVLERHRAPGACLAESNKDSKGTGALLLRGEAERSGPFQPQNGKAEGRPHQCLPVS